VIRDFFAPPAEDQRRAVEEEPCKQQDLEPDFPALSTPVSCLRRDFSGFENLQNMIVKRRRTNACQVKEMPNLQMFF
jgi:hypothetical protein